MAVLQSVFGLFVFVGLAYLLSEDKKRVRISGVCIGLGLQLLLGLLLLKLPLFQTLFMLANQAVLALQEATTAGTSFVFGYLGGGQTPFQVTEPKANFILAFRALPLVLFMSALSTLLFYWRILPRLVQGFSWFFQKALRIGGAEGLGLSANIFVGMVESPLFIRPYLKDLSRSELFSLMTCGMATIAGTVMVLYAGILQNSIPGVMGHILTASLISVPAAVTIAKIMVPESGPVSTGALELPEQASGPMDAVTQGTMQGVTLLINILAMLIVLVAFVHLINSLLGLVPAIQGQVLTLQGLLGWLLAPVAWLMGIPLDEVVTAGSLLGTKTMLNELIAYVQLSNLPEDALSPRSLLIMTYALCGFANPGSLGIMIGGLGTMAEERRPEIIGLGLRSIVAGTMATCMTGAVVGIMGTVSG
ncbi:MAG: nucleoside:proton symporter [Desulfohalobiaceae bacterium]|nr:nucleoside:proton symporter [Desulfohalobiaceae bacterium]